MGYRILIVDDDVETIRLIGLMLERRGYEIVAASTGAQGLDKALQAQPDLIILDVMMPDMDGYEVTRRMRATPELQTIPIVMFTAKSAITDKVAGFHAGVDDYLTKPVHPVELLSRVEALIQRSAARRTAGPVGESRQGRLLAVLPTKGGVGNTTLALNTTMELARTQTNERIVLAELTSGTAALAFQLGIPQRHSLQILQEKGSARLDLDAVNGQMVGHSSGVRLLLSSARPLGINPPLTEEFARALLRLLLIDNDIVVADLPPTLDLANREVLRQASYILLTIEPTKIGLALAKEMLERLELLNIGQYKIGPVIIHRTTAASSLNRTAVESALNLTLLSTIPPVPELVYESHETGKPLILMQPQSLVSQQIRTMVEEFKNSL